jgi:2-methylisocitrate lyase-like PEP mutase family enzyme
MSAPAHVTALQAALAQGSGGARRLISVPGCWDGLTALMIEQAGFEAAFLTGGGFSMTRLGRPDMGLVTSQEVEQTVAVIRERVDLPLIVDADTGFGNALNAGRTVRQFERAGATAIQLEDQTFPKRCGHMAGKGVVPLPEAVGRIRAALDARDHAMIIARTDAVSVEGFDAALERAEAFLEAGADLIFVEGPKTLEDTAEVGRRFGARAPLVHNLVEGGVTATRSGAELEAMGFAVALHPLMLLHGFVRLAPDLLARLKQARSTEAFAGEIASLADMNALTGAAEMVAQGARYDGREG